MTSLNRVAPLGAILALCLLAAPGLAETTAEQPAAAKTEKAAKPGKKDAVPKEVNIEADQMEIFDDKKQAVFKGNVDAKRTDVHLTCDELVVTYAETIDPTTKEKKSDVTFLDATGNVVIVTDKQTVTGKWAKMDVKANDLTVGENVKIVQGKNVLTGSKLFVDLDTNKSELTGGRVRGSFVNDQK
jgi:lipopolysaccharide export system protein LptA